MSKSVETIGTLNSWTHFLYSFTSQIADNAPIEKYTYNILFKKIEYTIDTYPWSYIEIAGSARKRCGGNELPIQSRLPPGSYRLTTIEFSPFEPIQIGKLLSKPNVKNKM